jgi:hypothetical protein
MTAPAQQEPQAPATPPTSPAAPEAAPAQAKPETDWKAEARKHEARAKENAAAAAELAALKESQKTEAQRLADRATAAEKERDEARLEALRVKVGATKQLPPKVIDLLKGDTEAELLAHAEELAALFVNQPPPSFDAGARSTAAAGNDPASEFATFINKQLR